ncbi:MAG: response regulator [Alphaproteobacteria bacterium]|nr:response regulator [Alphaproteobacteria bacterium]
MFIPRDQLSEDQLKEALNYCAEEPIYIPGSIQPHGMLVALNDNNIIEQISANAKDFFGLDAKECLGKNIESFLDKKILNYLRKVSNNNVFQPIKSITTILNGKSYDAVAHKSDNFLVIEFEPLLDSVPQKEFYYDQLRNYAIGMHKAKTLDEIFDHVINWVYHITGFDRVKLYRFDHDWHGEVVAEARKDYMPSYKGLHFPASDIPEQDRKLYMQNYLRFIANIQYKPIPIISVPHIEKKILDLSFTMLRSVSPIHIQYLENIGIQASMSISIIQNGKLWGLIACHHNEPLHVPYQVRNVCEIMGHIFSAQLSTMEEFAKRRAQDKRDQLVRQLSSTLDQNSRLDLFMQESHVLSMDALEADGLVVKTHTHILKYGEIPSDDILQKLIEWFKIEEGTIFYTNDASLTFKDIDILNQIVGGILAIPISSRSHDYIIWFRNAIIQEVSWAGNREKSIEQTSVGHRLTPRSSFKLWKQQVKHRSKAWLEDDIHTAQSIVKILLESEKLTAQQANLAKTEFLANMSHEIRTPINAIIGLSRILSSSKPLTTDQEEMIKALQISANSLNELINDILDHSKIESGTLELEKIPFNIKKLLQEVAIIVSVKALEKKISFTLNDTGILHQTYLGDPVRIRQIILNLCTNAIKFTEKGGVEVTVNTLISAEPLCKKIHCSVRDTGIGIASEKIDIIFDKFIQADNSVSRKYGGTGLGLSITKMLVEAMDGEINVVSEPGKGSEFTVSFDLEIASEYIENFSDDRETHNALIKQKPHILLVEDYEANIIVMCHYLDFFECSYDVARSGKEAIEKFKTQSYTAILMDVQIPKPDGFETTKLIRQHETVNRLSKTPIIGMTAHALYGDRDRCLKAGMDDYIAKPINENELKSKLELL